MGTIDSGDGELWSRSLTGDGVAFGVLFDRHRDRVYRHAYRLAQNRSDAEDASAAAFLELWRQRGEVILVQDSVLPWLLVTTTNCALNLRRATRRYDALLKRLPHSPDAEDPADIHLHNGSLDNVDPHLAAALRALTPADLQLFTLVSLEGYDIATAASILRLSPGAAKTRLHRARQRLRAHLPDPSSPGPLTLTQKGQP
ncbi:RNA polymerase sigma factor [Arthrobacter sp. TmT3-37]